MKLKDICKFVNEKVDTSSFHLEDYVSTENLLPNKGGVTVASKIPQGKATLFKKGDILISNIRPYFKKIYLAKKQGCCSNDVLCIRPNTNIPSSYLYYLLSQDSFFDYVMTGAKGTKMPRGDKGHIMNWAVYQSTLSQQQNIAEILTPLDDKIAVNSRICANLEAQAEALFKSWFVDFTPFKDQPFVDSELGPIPQGLKICQISDISHTLETGRRQKGGAVSEGIPSVGAEHVKGIGTYDYSKTKYISPEFANKLKTGKINGYELLIYKDGGKPGYFIPNFSIFGEGYPFDLCYLNEHVFKLDFLQNKGYNIFNYFQFKTNYVMSFLNAQGGKAAIPGINKKDIECIYTFAPNNPKVVEFGNFALPLFTKILRNCVENQRLAALRDTLLPKLMSGEIKL